jgi:hypothetical protein
MDARSELNPMAAKLVLTFNNKKVAEYPLLKETTTIGRRPDNDIAIENLAVSGRHAQIITILNDSFLEDLGSTNGTYVNGKLIKKHALQDGDVITLGKHQLTYVNETVEQPDEFEKTMIIRPDSKGMPEQTSNAEIEASIKKISAGLDQEHKNNVASGGNGSARQDASLQLLSGANAGTELQLSKALTTIGKPGVQVAAITKRPKGFFLIHVDGGPDNSRMPIVNGQAIGTQARELSDNDVIEIAGVKMQFFTR